MYKDVRSGPLNFLVKSVQWPPNHGHSIVEQILGVHSHKESAHWAVDVTVQMYACCLSG